MQFAKDAKCAPQKFDKDRFGTWLAKTNQDLDVCRATATSAKHYGFEQSMRPISQGSEGQIRTAAKFNELPLIDDLIDLDTLEYADCTLYLVIDGKKILLVDLFERVEGFWTQMIYSNQIDA
jgi:hypothetical protein